VGLAIATVLLVTDAAYLLTGSLTAASIMGLWSAFYPHLHHAVWYTQIENWYIPAFAAVVWAAIFYLQRPSTRRIIALGLAAAIVFNIRIQGVFFCASLVLIVLVPPNLRVSERVRQTLVYISIFLAIGWLPWSVRNAAVEGRLSPSTAQSAEGGAILNDPRIGLYGLRYGENYIEILREWMANYPHPPERQKAMADFFWQRLAADPLWFVEAAPWRVGAFYGLIPGNYFVAYGPRSFNWLNFGRAYLSTHFPFIALVVAAFLGLIARSPSRFTAFLIVLILANVSISLLVGFGEPRLSYPVFILHAFLALTAFAPAWRAHPCLDGTSEVVRLAPRPCTLLTAVMCLVIGAFIVHNFFGRSRLYRAVDAQYADFDPTLAVDSAMPLVTNEGPRLLLEGNPVERLEMGKSYRGVFVATAGMLPPGYAGLTDNIPSNANDRRLPRFQIFYLTTPDFIEGVLIPSRLLATRATDVIREQDLIEAEFSVVGYGGLSPTGHFLEITKARNVQPGRRVPD
jgi:hypothetical protein